MARKQFTYQINFKGDTSGLKGVYAEINRIAERAKTVNFTSTMQSATKEAQSLRDVLRDAWDSKLNRFDMTKVNRGIQQTYGSMVQFRTAMQQAGYEGTMMFNRIAQESVTSSLQMRKHSAWITSFVTSLKGHIRWFISSKITQTAIGSISKAYNFTKDLDKALNNIRIVTNKSKKEMAEFAKYAQQAALSLSASTKSYAEASLIYYQQGLSDKEVRARTNTTMKVANVTGMDAETASEQLTAVWNGYRVSMAETEAYIDKLAKVASTTASSLEELSTSMGKVASTADTVGVDIDQLTAQLSTMISVTKQSPESIGNALKTIFARMTDLKVDGTDDSGVSLGKVSSTMKQLGINILNQKGELRDLGVVIEETMSKWNGWTKAQKNAAAIAMAGTRQYNNLYALFENQDKYNKALVEAKGATGALQKQQETYEDSTTAKLQELSTAAEKLYSGLFDQSSVQTLVSGFTKVVDVIGNFTKGLRSGTIVLANLGNIATLVFRKQLAQNIQLASTNIRGFFSNSGMFSTNQSKKNSALRARLENDKILRPTKEADEEEEKRGRYYNFFAKYQNEVEGNVSAKIMPEAERFYKNQAFMSTEEKQKQLNRLASLAQAYRGQEKLKLHSKFEEDPRFARIFEGVDLKDPDAVLDAYRSEQKRIATEISAKGGRVKDTTRLEEGTPTKSGPPPVINYPSKPAANYTPTDPAMAQLSQNGRQDVSLLSEFVQDYLNQQSIDTSNLKPEESLKIFGLQRKKEGEPVQVGENDELKARYEALSGLFAQEKDRIRSFVAEEIGEEEIPENFDLGNLEMLSKAGVRTLILEALADIEEQDLSETESGKVLDESSPSDTNTSTEKFYEDNLKNLEKIDKIKSSSKPKSESDNNDVSANEEPMDAQEFLGFILDTAAGSGLGEYYGKGVIDKKEPRAADFLRELLKDSSGDLLKEITESSEFDYLVDILGVEIPKDYDANQFVRHTLGLDPLEKQPTNADKEPPINQSENDGQLKQQPEEQTKEQSKQSEERTEEQPEQSEERTEEQPEQQPPVIDDATIARSIAQVEEEDSKRTNELTDFLKTYTNTEEIDLENIKPSETREIFGLKSKGGSPGESEEEQERFNAISDLLKQHEDDIKSSVIERLGEETVSKIAGDENLDLLSSKVLNNGDMRKAILSALAEIEKQNLSQKDTNDAEEEEIETLIDQVEDNIASTEQSDKASESLEQSAENLTEATDNLKDVVDELKEKIDQEEEIVEDTIVTDNETLNPSLENLPIDTSSTPQSENPQIETPRSPDSLNDMIISLEDQVQQISEVIETAAQNPNLISDVLENRDNILRFNFEDILDKINTNLPDIQLNPATISVLENILDRYNQLEEDRGNIFGGLLGSDMLELDNLDEYLTEAGLLNDNVIELISQILNAQDGTPSQNANADTQQNNDDQAINDRNIDSQTIRHQDVEEQDVEEEEQGDDSREEDSSADEQSDNSQENSSNDEEQIDPAEVERNQLREELKILKEIIESMEADSDISGPTDSDYEQLQRDRRAEIDTVNEEAEAQAKIGKWTNLITTGFTTILTLQGLLGTLGESAASFSDKLQSVTSILAITGPQIAMAVSSFVNPVAGALVTGGLAILGVIGQAVSSWYRSQEEAIQKSAQAFEEASNKITQISDNWSSIQQYKTEYETLAQGVGTLGQNLRLTNSQYDRFIELSNILGSKFPELINGYDEQGQAIIATNAAFKDLEQSIKNQNKEITTQKEFTDYLTEKDKEKKKLQDDLGKTPQEQVIFELQSVGIDEGFQIKGKSIAQYFQEIDNVDLSNIQEILTLFKDEYTGNQEERVKTISKALLDRFSEEEDTLKQNEAVRQKKTETINEDIIEKSITFAQLSDPDLIINSDKQKAYKTILRFNSKIDADAAIKTAEFIKTLSPEQLKTITAASNKNLTYNDYISQYQGFGQNLTKEQVEKIPSWMKSTTISYGSNNEVIRSTNFNSSLFTRDQQKTLEQISQDIFTQFKIKTSEEQDQFRQFLQKTITGQDLDNYTDLSNLLGIDWTKISNIDTGKKIIEQRAKTTQSLEAPQTDYKGVNSVLQNITEADEKVKSGKELSDEDLKNIYDYNGSNEKVLDTINKMKSVRDTSSQEFKDLLEDYLQQMEDLSKESAVNTINIAYETLDTNLKVLNEDLDEYGLDFAEVQSKYLELEEEEFSKWLKKKTSGNEEAVVEITADLSNYNTTMDTIKEAEYEKTVTIKADIQSDFNKGFEVIDKMVSLSEILSKGLTIEISDIQKLVEQGYGAILENATAAANGQIVLNKEVVNTIVKAKQEEFATEIKIQQERNELKVKQLDAEIEIAELELEMLEKSLASEDTVEKAAYLAKAQMLENERKNIEDNYSIEWQNAKELTESQQQLATNLSNFMLTQRQSLTGEFLSLNASIDASNKAVAENQIGYYQQMGVAAKAFLDQNWDNLQNVGAVKNQKDTLTFNDLKDSDKAFQQWKAELAEKNKELADSITSAEFNLMGGILENSGQDPEVMDAVTRSKIKVGSELLESLKQSRAMYSSLNTADIAGYSAITTGLEDIQDAVGKTNDLLEDEIDRFHYLEKVIEKVSKVMNKLTDAQEKLIGTGLQENLQQQITLLQEENKLQERKREIAQSRINELKDTVAGYGAIFDNNGYIANYTELMTGILNGKNSLTTQYNAMTKAAQEVNKELYDQEQKKLEHAEKIISQYEESISKDEEAEEQQYQNNNDMIEKQIAYMKVMSDLYLDIAEIQDKFREYRSTVIDRVGERDYQKKIENAIEDLASGEQKVQIHQQRLTELLEQERQMEVTGTSSEYGENEAQLREDIKEETSSLMDLQKSNIESINSAFTALTQGLEDTFAVVNDFYSNQQAELDFRLKLINLLGGSSVLQERIYNQQAEYYKGQLEAAKQETKLWNDQLDKAKQSNATEDQIRELTDKANEARKKENDLVISSIESLKNNYQSLIKSKLDEGFKSINDLQDQYNWTKALNEPWLDDTTRMYEIQKFQLSVQSEIDNTASEFAQKRLNEVMEEQLDILRTKDQLTKNDVDRANKIFDITKKQIALEEARQNKTRMRLRRDSQGNYNFQYVANEGEIQEKEKDLLASTQDFYDSQKEYSKKSLEDAFAFVKQYREEVEKVYLDETLSEEEKNQKVATMREQAEQHILALAIESKYAQEMLLKDLYEYSLPTLYTMNSQNFIDSLNVEGSALKDWGALYVNEWMSACDVGNQTLQSLTNASTNFYQNLSDLDKTILVETVVPEFTEAVQTLMDKFTEPDGFNDVTNFAFTECERLSREYEQALNDLGNTAGYNFTQIHNGAWADINDKEQAIQKIKTTNAELQTQIEKYTSLSSTIDAVNDSFTNFANNSDALVKGSVDTLTGWTDTFSNLSRMHRAFIQDFVDGNKVFSGEWGGITWGSAMTDALNASSQKVAETQKVINNAPTEGKYVTNKKEPTKTAKDTTKDGILSNGEKAVLRSMSAGELKSDNGIHNYWKSILASRSGHQVILYRIIKGEHGDGWKILDVNTAPNSYIIEDQERKNIIYDEASYQYGPMILKGKQLIEKLLKPGSYDTGGYTGAWHSQEGKWAILHEKELVLNKDDTKNLLSTIKLTRGFASTIQNIETNLANHLNQLQNKMTNSFENINVQTARQSEQQGVQQHFTVNASFPNVESVNDIKEAFKYLSTYGQQYINRRY